MKLKPCLHPPCPRRLSRSPSGGEAPPDCTVPLPCPFRSPVSPHAPPPAPRRGAASSPDSTGPRARGKPTGPCLRAFALAGRFAWDSHSRDPRDAAGPLVTHLRKHGLFSALRLRSRGPWFHSSWHLIMGLIVPLLNYYLSDPSNRRDCISDVPLLLGLPHQSTHRPLFPPNLEKTIFS